MHKQFLQGPTARQWAWSASGNANSNAQIDRNLKYRRRGCPFMNIYALFYAYCDSPKRTAEGLQYDTEIITSLLQTQIRRPPEHRICPLWTPQYSFRHLFRNYSQRRLLEQHAVIKINRSLIKACMNFIFWPSGNSIILTAPESWGPRPHRQRYWHFLKPSTI